MRALSPSLKQAVLGVEPHRKRQRLKQHSAFASSTWGIRCHPEALFSLAPGLEAFCLRLSRPLTEAIPSTHSCMLALCLTLC